MSTLRNPCRELPQRKATNGSQKEKKRWYWSIRETAVQRFHSPHIVQQLFTQTRKTTTISLRTTVESNIIRYSCYTIFANRDSYVGQVEVSNHKRLLLCFIELVRPFYCPTKGKQLYWFYPVANCIP